MLNRALQPVELPGVDVASDVCDDGATDGAGGDGGGGTGSGGAGGGGDEGEDTIDVLDTADVVVVPAMLTPALANALVIVNVDIGAPLESGATTKSTSTEPAEMLTIVIRDAEMPRAPATSVLKLDSKL